MFNNGGASLFYYNTRGLKNFPSLDKNAGAAHISSAKAWAESRGFTYISSTNKEEFDNLYPLFLKEETNTPVLFEVFTDRAVDGQVWHSILESQKGANGSTANVKGNIKSKIKNILKDILKG